VAGHADNTTDISGTCASTIIASRSYYEEYVAVATYYTEGLIYNTGGSGREWQEKTNIPNKQATIMVE
jgi:hypothetical protein